MIDRRHIMKDAKRRWLSRQRFGDLALSWAECLRRAWAAWRLRFKSIDIQMREIAASINSHSKSNIQLFARGR